MIETLSATAELRGRVQCAKDKQMLRNYGGETMSDEPTGGVRGKL